MPAVISLIVAGLCTILFIFLLSPVGRGFSEFIEQQSTIAQRLNAALFLNLAAVSYLVYFFVRLGDRETIWLINVFTGWAMMLASAAGMAIGLEYSNDLGALGKIDIGSDWRMQVACLSVGAIFTYASSKRYKGKQMIDS